MAETKYRWYYSIGWAVEFVRKDSEITINLDGEKLQLVVATKAPTQEIAEERAINYAKLLDEEIKEFVKQRIAILTRAQE